MTERNSVWSGGIAGVAAYLLGYVVTYAWKAGDYRDALETIGPIVEFLGGETPGAWRVVGWLYYSAHYVETTVDLGVRTVYVNLVQEGSGNLELLYLLPPLILVAAGYVVGRNVEYDDVLDAAKTGAWVTLGYLPLVALGAVLFQSGGSGPDLVPSLLLAGLLYPVVFGAVGGVLARGAQ